MMHLAMCWDSLLPRPHSLPVSLCLSIDLCAFWKIASEIKSGTVEGYENAYQDDLSDRTAGANASANLFICSLPTVNSDQNA